MFEVSGPQLIGIVIVVIAIVLGGIHILNRMRRANQQQAQNAVIAKLQGSWSFIKDNFKRPTVPLVLTAVVALIVYEITAYVRSWYLGPIGWIATWLLKGSNIIFLAAASFAIGSVIIFLLAFTLLAILVKKQQHFLVPSWPAIILTALMLTGLITIPLALLVSIVYAIVRLASILWGGTKIFWEWFWDGDFWDLGFFNFWGYLQKDNYWERFYKLFVLLILFFMVRAIVLRWGDKIWAFLKRAALFIWAWTRTVTHPSFWAADRYRKAPVFILQTYEMALVSRFGNIVGESYPLPLDMVAQSQPADDAEGERGPVPQPHARLSLLGRFFVGLGGLRFKLMLSDTIEKIDQGIKDFLERTAEVMSAGFASSSESETLDEMKKKSTPHDTTPQPGDKIAQATLDRALDILREAGPEVSMSLAGQLRVGDPKRFRKLPDSVRMSNQALFQFVREQILNGAIQAVAKRTLIVDMKNMVPYVLCYCSPDRSMAACTLVREDYKSLLDFLGRHGITNGNVKRYLPQGFENVSAVEQYLTDHLSDARIADQPVLRGQHAYRYWMWLRTTGKLIGIVPTIGDIYLHNGEATYFVETKAQDGNGKKLEPIVDNMTNLDFARPLHRAALAAFFAKLNELQSDCIQLQVWRATGCVLVDFRISDVEPEGAVKEALSRLGKEQVNYLVERAIFNKRVLSAHGDAQKIRIIFEELDLFEGDPDRGIAPATKEDYLTAVLVFQALRSLEVTAIEGQNTSVIMPMGGLEAMLRGFGGGSLMDKMKEFGGLGK